MAEFEKLKTDFKNAESTFKNGLDDLRDNFQKHQTQETGRVSIDDGFIEKYPSDFSLHYCLTETMAQLERCISEKPSR